MKDLDILLYIGAIIFYLAPIALILNDKHSRGQEKNIWLIVSLFLSWFAYLLYISTVKKHKASPNKKVKTTKKRSN